MVFGKLVGFTRVEGGKIVIECMLRDKLGSLVGDFAGMCRGVEVCQLVGQVIEIFGGMEVGRDVNGCVEHDRHAAAGENSYRGELKQSAGN